MKLCIQCATNKCNVTARQGPKAISTGPLPEFLARQESDRNEPQAVRNLRMRLFQVQYVREISIPQFRLACIQ